MVLIVANKANQSRYSYGHSIIICLFSDVYFEKTVKSFTEKTKYQHEKQNGISSLKFSYVMSSRPP